MPKETVESVIRTALAAKLPKLGATAANERILLLELESPSRSNWEIGQMIDDVKGDFADIAAISGVWLAKTPAWETEGYVGFHLICPLDQVGRYQECSRTAPIEGTDGTG